MINLVFFSSYRSFYIAISFVQQKRYKESAALVNKSEIYMEQAKKTVNDGQQPKSSEINYQVRSISLFDLIMKMFFCLNSHY
jgi:hypothetical protein